MKNKENIPVGVANVPLRDMEADTWVEKEIPCFVEVMMTCFTKNTCRIRITPVESWGGWDKGDTYGNIDATMTPSIMKLIANFAMDTQHE